MSVSKMIHPDGSDFDTFLYADLGADSSGSRVSVLSALARLGLEPWSEARVLAVLGREDAQTRLAAHLMRMGNMSTPPQTRRLMADNLVTLLPRRAGAQSPQTPPATAFGRSHLSLGAAFGALVILVVLARLYYLAQTF